MSRTLTISVVIALILGLPSAAPAAPQCADPDRVTRGGDGWESIRAPEGDGIQFTHLRLTVDPQDRDVFYLTMEGPNDGLRWLYRTLDGGCTWEQIFQTEEPVPGVFWFDNAKPTIASTVVADDGTLFVVVESPFEGWDPGAFGRKGLDSVWATSDRGKTWQRVDAGLPNLDRYTDDPGQLRDHGLTGSSIVASPSDPKALYLSGRLGWQPDMMALYATKDGGKSWQLRGRFPTDPTQNPAGYALTQSPTESCDECVSVGSIQIDPANPDELWVGGRNGRLRHSVDGGRTFKTLFDANPFPGARAIYRPSPSVDATLAIFPQTGQGGGQDYFHHSTDGGGSWTKVGVPFVNVGWAAYGKNTKSMVAHTDSFSPTERIMYLHPRSGRWLEITPATVRVESGSVVDISLTSGPRPTLFLASGGTMTVERYTRKL